MDSVVKVLRAHRQELQTEVDRVDAALAILVKTTKHGTTHGGTRRMSAAARARIGRGVRRAHRLRNGKAVKGAK